MGMPEPTGWERFGYEAAHFVVTTFIGGSILAAALLAGAKFLPAFIGCALISWAFWEMTK